MFTSGLNKSFNTVLLCRSINSSCRLTGALSTSTVNGLDKIFNLLSNFLKSLKRHKNSAHRSLNFLLYVSASWGPIDNEFRGVGKCCNFFPSLELPFLSYRQQIIIYIFYNINFNN